MTSFEGLGRDHGNKLKEDAQTSNLPRADSDLLFWRPYRLYSSTFVKYIL